MSRTLLLISVVVSVACGEDASDVAMDTDTSTTEASDTEGSAIEAGIQLAFLSAPSAATSTIYLNDTCRGDGCPTPLTELELPVAPLGGGETDVEACDPSIAPEGLTEEYACSALAAQPQLEFVFVTPLAHESFELVRERPGSDPIALEPFAWSPEVVRVDGPQATYRGDFAVGEENEDWPTFEMTQIDVVQDGGFRPAEGRLDRRCESGRDEPIEKCRCEDTSAACGDPIARECAPPWGVADPSFGGVEGDYALGRVVRHGGPTFDVQTRTLKLRLDLFGSPTDAMTDSCPGFYEGDWFFSPVHHDGQFDHALCSDSTYFVEFSTSQADTYIEGVEGETFDGGSTFEFHTAPFSLIPGSKFPSDDLTIVQSETISVRFTAVPTFTAQNLGRVFITRGGDDLVVAGGPSCDPQADEDSVAAGDAIPCLTFDPEDIRFGKLSFRIDEERYGRPLQVGERYFVHFPNEESDEPFVDVCGNALRADGVSTVGWTIDGPG